MFQVLLQHSSICLCFLKLHFPLRATIHAFSYLPILIKKNDSLVKLNQTGIWKFPVHLNISFVRRWFCPKTICWKMLQNVILGLILTSSMFDSVREKIGPPLKEEGSYRYVWIHRLRYDHFIRRCSFFIFKRFKEFASSFCMYPTFFLSLNAARAPFSVVGHGGFKDIHGEHCLWVNW